MQDINALRLFEELRLHPWKPGDKLIIDAHLAMLGVTDPQRGAAYAKRYADKLDSYLASQPKAEEPKEEPKKEEPKKAKKLSLSPKKDA